MVDVLWGSKESLKFITNVGLITSYGPDGHNIMACEWTHHISYSPGLIAVCIHKNDATASNIKETKEFGVNLASIEQSKMSSISGSSTGKKTDKIAVLKELGFEFYKAKKIKPLMIKNSPLNVECKLYKEIELGDHIIFVGEAVEATSNPIEALAYHDGKYWKMSTPLEKPSQEELDNINSVVEKYKK
ncbi:MAG: flavin reductase family protein [Nanoarchaeota archaeon]